MTTGLSYDGKNLKRLSQKFTLAISETTKARIRKLPRGEILGAYLRPALDKILDELEGKQ